MCIPQEALSQSVQIASIRTKQAESAPHDRGFHRIILPRMEPALSVQPDYRWMTVSSIEDPTTRRNQKANERLAAIQI